MKLTETQKKQIEEDLAAYTNEYAGKTREERKSRGKADPQKTNRKNEKVSFTNNLKALIL